MAILQAGGCQPSLQDAGATVVAGKGEPGFAPIRSGRHTPPAARLGAEIDPVQDLGWGVTFEARDRDGHHLTVYRLEQ